MGTAMTLATTTWLGRMPAMSLARSVPVITPEGRKGIVTIVLRGDLVSGGEGVEVAWDDGEHGTTGKDVVDSVDLRVDIDDTVGLDYVVRRLMSGRGIVPLAHAMQFGTGRGLQYSGSDFRNWLFSRLRYEDCSGFERVAIAEAAAAMKAAA